MQILKLGGSVITYKDKPQSADLEAIRALAKVIGEAWQAGIRDIVLVHGAGSFGHALVLERKIDNGVRTDEQKVGAANTHAACAKLTTILIEALLAEGVPIEAVDRAMTHWGFPVGPITLLDEVGLDVAVKAGGVMYEAFGERLKPRINLAALVADRRLGRKNGRGFFVYRRGRKGDVDPSAYAVLGVAPGEAPAEELIAERLAFAMLNEAARALEEGVIRVPRDGDVGAIFGIGFPPFRGGPFRALDAMGARAAVETLQRLAAAHGDRFLPAASLVEQARGGGGFYPRGR